MNSPLRPLHLDRVSLGVLDREILECDTLLARDQQAFTSGSLSLVLKLRIVSSGPWPRIVTESTSSESVARNSNRPGPNSMISPGLALISAV